MKKLLSTVLVTLFSVAACTLPVSAHTAHVNDGEAPQFNGATSANAFGDLLDWNGVVFGNAKEIIDLEGTLAVGGNFSSSRGLSINHGANGSAPAVTDDVALLVNNNVNINGYGDVDIQDATLIQRKLAEFEDTSVSERSLNKIKNTPKV